MMTCLGLCRDWLWSMWPHSWFHLETFQCSQPKVSWEVVKAWLTTTSHLPLQKAPTCPLPYPQSVHITIALLHPCKHDKSTIRTSIIINLHDVINQTGLKELNHFTNKVSVKRKRQKWANVEQVKVNLSDNIRGAQLGVSEKGKPLRLKPMETGNDCASVYCTVFMRRCIYDTAWITTACRNCLLKTLKAVQNNTAEQCTSVHFDGFCICQNF